MIKGKTVDLIPATPEDKQKVYEWCFQSETTKSHAGPPDYPEIQIPTIEEFYDDYKDYYFTGSEPKGGRQYFIVAEGEPIGCISYSAFHLKPGIAELDNWIISEANCGKGFGTDAIIALSDFLHEALGFHTMIMGPSSRNTRAIRAYEKAGLMRTDLSMSDFLLDEFITIYGDGDYGKDDTVVCMKRFARASRAGSK
jgi:RimJ/RimL family protein N-acetyltransferase